MSVNTLDVIVFIPLIPALPVLATWYLPWERWIPRKISKSIIGPYLLYCAFAAWHFRGPWWVVALVGLGGFIVSAMAWTERYRLKQASSWPGVEGLVVGVGESRDQDEVKVTITYSYTVRDERYGGSESFVFTGADDAWRFMDGYKDRTVRVRYRPDQPDKSVLDRDPKT